MLSIKLSAHISFMWISDQKSSTLDIWWQSTVKWKNRVLFKQNSFSITNKSLSHLCILSLFSQLWCLFMWNGSKVMCASSSRVTVELTSFWFVSKYFVFQHQFLVFRTAGWLSCSAVTHRPIVFKENKRKWWRQKNAS